MFATSRQLQVQQHQYNEIPFLLIYSALYNAVPPDIKSIPTLEKFKAALDSFLHSVPDTPPTPGYTGANGNSLLEWAGSKSQ